MCWIEDNLDDLFDKFKYSKFMMEIEKKETSNMKTGANERIKNIFKFTLFSRAEKWVDSKYTRRHIKLINVV